MIPFIKNPMLTLSVLAGLMALAGCQHQTAAVSSGVLVSAQKSKLVVSHPGGGGIRAFPLTPRTQITLNGHRATWKDLNRYPSVNVRIKHKGAGGMATEVAAVATSVRHAAAKPIIPATTIPRGSIDPPGAEGPGAAEERASPRDHAGGLTQEPAGLATFEGEIVSIDDDGFLLRVGDERRFVQIPDEASVMILDKTTSKPGQIATVVAEQADDDYIARAVVVRPE